jgi:hypothetical protein
MPAQVATALLIMESWLSLMKKGVCPFDLILALVSTLQVLEGWQHYKHMELLDMGYGHEALTVQLFLVIPQTRVEFAATAFLVMGSKLLA